MKILIIIGLVLCVIHSIKKHSIKKKLMIQSIEKQSIENKIRTVTSLDRGTPSERDLILTLLDMGIPAKSIFHDVYLKKSNDTYAQIDLVVPTRVGILVFEVKDYSGWIFGKGGQDRWTQVLSYGEEKYYFYNPVKQNEGHIKELRKKLGEDVPFFSIIVFYGNSELRDISFIPKGTFVAKWYRVEEVVSNILQSNPDAVYKNKQNVVRVLREAVKNGEDSEIDSKHVGDIREMIGNDRIFD